MRSKASVATARYTPVMRSAGMPTKAPMAAVISTASGNDSTNGTPMFINAT